MQMIFLVIALLSLASPNSYAVEDSTQINLEVVNQIRQASEKSSTHSGMAIDLGLSSVLSGNLSADIQTFQDQIAVYCVSGLGINTDLGGSLIGAAVQRYNCSDPKTYGGWFLNLNICISAELSSIPGAACVTGSVGVNIDNFSKDLKSAIKTDASSIKEAIKNALRKQPERVIENPTLLLLFSIVNGAFLKDEEIRALLLKLIVENPQKTIKELSKKLVSAQNERVSLNIFNHLHTNDTQALEPLLKAYYQNISGCNSLSSGGGVSLSVMPVSIGVSTSHYQLVTEIPRDRLKDKGFLDPHDATWTMVDTGLNQVNALSSQDCQAIKDGSDSANKYKIFKALINMPITCAKNISHTSKVVSELLSPE